METEQKVKVEKDFKFLFERSRYKASYGGRGGKKSWGYGKGLVILCCMYRLRALCCREVQKSIKDSVKKLIEDTIHREGLSSLFYITQTSIINKETGSEILFSGLQDHTSDSIKSFESIDICWVEEAHSISQKSLSILVPTIRKKNSEIWFSWNPDSPTDPVDKMFRGDHIPKDSIIKEFSYLDNQYLPQSFLDEAERVKEEDYERYCHIYLGHYKNEGDNQLISYSIVKKAIDRTPEFMDVPIVGAIDPAREGNDRTAFVLRRGNEIVFKKTWKKTDDYYPLADEIANNVVELGVVALGVDYIGVGAGFIDILKRKVPGSCVLVKFNSGFKANEHAYLNKRAECYALLKKWLIECGKIPNDSDLIEDLTSIKYFYNNKTQLQLYSKEKLKEAGGKSPDIGDALMMTFDETLLNSIIEEEEYYEEETEWMG